VTLPGVTESDWLICSQPEELADAVKWRTPVVPGAVATVSVCGSIVEEPRKVTLEGVTARPAALLPDGAMVNETVVHAPRCNGPTLATTWATYVPWGRFEGLAVIVICAGDVP
jgi:hypothetical protein